MHGRFAQRRSHFARHERRRDEGIFPLFEKRREREFGEALPEVCRTAPEVGLQPEHVRIGRVGVEDARFVLHRTGDLIALLIVLVRPHIGRDRRGQSVEGEHFQPVCPDALFRQGEQPFIGIHRLDDAAQLGAVDGARARKALVPRKMPDRRAVILFKQSEHPLRVFVLNAAFLLQEAAIKRPRFEAHGGVHDVRIHRPLLVRLLPERTRRRKVGPFDLQNVRKLLHPRLGAAFIQPQERDEAFVPPCCRPAVRRVGADMIAVLKERAVDRLFDAPVVRALLPYDEHFQDEEERPDVVVLALLFGAGADPAVFALPSKDLVDIPFGADDHVLIPQQKGERDEAVQPIGNAFPALAAAAHPFAVAHVRPDLVEIARKPARLDLELLFQPAARRDLLCRQPLHTAPSSAFSHTICMGARVIPRGLPEASKKVVFCSSNVLLTSAYSPLAA